MKPFSSVEHLLESIQATIRAGGRFPVEIALGLATAFVASMGISQPGEWGTFSVEFFMTVLPTLIGVFAISALYELDVLDVPRRWGLTAAALLGGLAYGVFILDTALVAENWRWFYLTGALSLGAMLTPLAARPDGLTRRELTWRFNLRFGSRMITSGAYTTLLTIGTLLGVISFDSLFDLHLDGEIYGHIAVWIFAVGMTWLVATGLPSFAERHEPTDKAQQTIVYRVASLLALPLLGLYMLILYAYGLKVLMTGQAPSNLLSPLALGAALLGLVTLFFVEPLRADPKRRWLTDLLDKFPLAYLPILPMPAWAIWVRVEQHGWTEFRYLRMLSVAGIAICFGYAAYKTVRGKTYSTAIMPALFALLTFFAAFGPWGALNVSQRSQIVHLQQELEHPDQENGTTSETRYDYRVSTTDAHRRTRYLIDHFGGRSLRPLLGPDAPTPKTATEAFEALGLPENAPGSPKTPTYYRYDGPIALPAAGTVHRVDPWQGGDSQTYELKTEGLIVTATSSDGETFQFSLEERLGKMRDYVEKRDDTQLSEALATLSAVDSAEESAPTLVVEQLSVQRASDSEAGWKITNVRGLLFVPEGE